MSNTRKILAAIGGGALIATLAAAYLVWTAYQGRNELADELAGAVSQIESLSRAKIYACKESVDEIAADVGKVAGWKDEVFSLVSAGDRVYEKTTAPAFKNFVVGEAKRLSGLSGDDGKIIGDGFSFGPFKDYIFEGKMPGEAALPELQRQWDDVVFMIETLAASGISRITEIKLLPPEEPKVDMSKKRNAKNRKRHGAKKDIQEEEKNPVVNPWSVSFETRPAGYVKTLNAFALSPRFAVVGGAAVSRKADVIAEALGGAEKKDETPRQTGRRRRRAVSFAKEEVVDVSEKLKNGVVTDPALDEPLKITMKLKIYDFRTLENPAVDADADGKKGASK